MQRGISCYYIHINNCYLDKKNYINWEFKQTQNAVIYLKWVYTFFLSAMNNKGYMNYYGTIVTPYIYKLKGNLILFDNNGTLQERITNVKNKRDFEI